MAVADSPPSRPSGARRRVPARRLAVVLGILAATAGLAILIAMRLDAPADPGVRDEAQPVVGGRVVVPAEPARGALPPLALVLDRPLPRGIEELPPAEQAARLRARAALTAEPRRLVELGAVEGSLGDTTAAGAAFADALTLDPQNLAARVGRVLNDAAAGGAEALEDGEEALRALEQAHPESPLVAFNRGWLAIYRRDPQTAEAAWRRTLILDADGDLGLTARRLLDALDDPTDGSRP